MKKMILIIMMLLFANNAQAVTYAQVRSGEVINIVPWTEARQPQIEGQQFITIQEPLTVRVGDTYKDGTFTHPVVVPPPVNRTISIDEFRSRFTFNERVSIKSQAKTDSQVAVVDEDFSAATINLDSQAIIDDLILLVSKGLLDAGRPAEIRK